MLGERRKKEGWGRIAGVCGVYVGREIAGYAITSFGRGCVGTEDFVAWASQDELYAASWYLGK